MATPYKLSPSEAKRKILLILEEGTVDFSLHCRRDSMPEAHVDDVDVVNVLRDGQIIREAEWDTHHENWKYRVEGADTEGEELTAITIIFEENLSLLVVTVF